MVLLRLLTFLRPHWRHLLLAVLVGFLTIAASISLMSTSAWLISTAAIATSIAQFGVSVVGVRFFGIARALARYAERLVSHSLTFKLLANLRVWFYQSVEPLAPARLISARSGDLLSRVISDIESLDNFYVRALAPPLVAIVIILGMGIFMGTFSVSLGLTIVGFLLALGLGLTALTLILNRAPGQILVEQRSRLRADLVDSVQGLPDLVAFGQEKTYFDKVQAAGSAYSATQTRLARLNGFQSGLSTLITGLGALTMLYLAIPLVTEGHIAGVMLAVVVLGTMASFEAVQGLPQAAQLLEANLQAARRLFQIADSKPAVSDPPAPLPRPASADLSIANLSFAYLSDTETTGFHGENKQESVQSVHSASRKVLDNITLSLPAGRKIAIVGPSGAGKTTLANLLLRFWNYTEGQVLLDGHELRQYAQTDVRRMFSVVSQNTYLFNASLRENLLLARPWATQADLEKACQQAELHDFIISLPEGYDTFVGERGLNLSGGERQRLAIARALLKDAPILLFDEPTANLDPATERKIINTLHSLISAPESVVSKSAPLRESVTESVVNSAPLRESATESVVNSAPLRESATESVVNSAPLRESATESVVSKSVISKSVLWITHRLIGLDQMDEILVLDAGKIVESGTHAELLAQNGLYRKMWDLQNRALID
jgi:ATP-binding cassette subfamily C protein CydC